MVRPLRFSLLLFASAALCHAAEPGWLDLASPIITPAEKKAYVSLKGEDREKFEETFWGTKNITAREYRDRFDYIDANFGSGKFGSGVNTDQGRVYLSLGPPNKITRIPSSRSFNPIEIWYYSEIPGVLNTEVALMFYLKNNVGLPKLYSPTRDTIRALLLPQAANVDLFGPNDDLTEQQIRQSIQAPPGEDEIVSASVNVASGVRYEENDTIIGRVASPQFMLATPITALVKSRFIVSRPKLDILETPSPFGGSQVDLGLEVTAQKTLDVEVLANEITVYQNHLSLKFPDPAPIRYTHRLDLLPGTYRLIFDVDGKHFPYSLIVPDPVAPNLEAMSEILRADRTDMTAEHRLTPFSFESNQFDLNADGKAVLIALPEPQKVTWMIRSGTEVVWRSVSDAASAAWPAAVAWTTLPSHLPPGTYSIEANTASKSKRSPLVIRADKPSAAASTVLSFNANLAPSLRYAFVGHQWLLRGKLDEARKSLSASLDKGATEAAEIELARVDALSSQLDSARNRIRSVLAVHADSFEALAVFAYIETKFQDYPAAAELYRRALAVQDSPNLRAALAELDRKGSGN